MALPRIVPDLVHLAQKAAKANAAGLWLLNDAGTQLQCVFYEGMSQDYVECVRELPLGTMTCGRAVVEQRPVIARDLRSDPEYKPAWKTPVRSCFSVPVVGHGERVLGSLACHFLKVHSPSSYDVERNQLFAKLIAFAIEEQAEKAA